MFHVFFFGINFSVSEPALLVVAYAVTPASGLISVSRNLLA